MNKEEIKQYLKDNLHIHADTEAGYYGLECSTKIVITLSLGKEILSETKIFL